MMPGKTTHQRTYGGVQAAHREEERCKRLITAGLEAFGATGYAKANIKTICHLAGLTERYFYESFESKEELLCAVYRQLIANLERQALAILADPSLSPLQATERVLEMFFHYFQEDPSRARVQLFEVLGVGPRVDQEYQRALRKLSEMVKLFLCRIFPGIQPEALHHSVVPSGLAGMVMLISGEWVMDGFKTPLEEIIPQCMDMFTAVGRGLAEKQPYRKK